jgi:hypothetical protein
MRFVLRLVTSSCENSCASALCFAEQVRCALLSFTPSRHTSYQVIGSDAAMMDFWWKDA